jgi:hypothetical protein
MADVPPLFASFACDEFLIYQDNTCHLGTEGDGQMTLSPATFLLTNRHAIIFTQAPRPESVTALVSDITSVYEETLYDCHVLTILCAGPHPLHVFMPIESSQSAFCRMLTNLVSAFKEDRNSGDSLALSFRALFLRTLDLPEFYRQVEHAGQVRSDSFLHEFFTPPLARLIASIIETSELLLLCIVLFFAIVLTMFFYFVPFAIFLFGGVVAFMVFVGVRLAFHRDVPVEGRFDARLTRRFQGVIEVYEEFRAHVGDRFLWENPRATLEILMFLSASGLLFTSFDAATIFSLSLLGIAVVERWNPLGFGSPLDLLAELFRM